MLNISEQVAQFTQRSTFQELPHDVVHAAKRALLNYFSVCIAAYRDPAIEKLIQAVKPFSGHPTTSIIAWNQQSDMLNACAINAMAANVFDFDDTHIPTIIHPTVPVVSPLLALAQQKEIHGQDFLLAMVLGMEMECRIGNAISPYHYNHGWHITSTSGVFGAALASAKILKLNQQQLVWALGNAANQACGLVENLGTMSKSLSVGNAAKNGLMAALLARENFDGPADPLNGERGFLKVFGKEYQPQCITDGLGHSWEILMNTFKPYPCGVVLNPVIEACLGVYQQEQFNPDFLPKIQSIRVHGNPLLRQRADRPDITTGRQSQVSGQHAIAVVLRYGQAGLKEFSDNQVSQPANRAMYAKIHFIDDDMCPVDAVKIEFICSDRTFHAEIGHAKGSVTHPLSDHDLEQKCIQQLKFHGMQCDTAQFFENIWHLESNPDIGNWLHSLKFNPS
jgi:2-methylcitrate dehydratase PrpD